MCEIIEEGQPIQRQNHLSNEKIAALTREYLGGSEIVELARKYGVNRKTVPSLLRKNNVPMRKRYPVMEPSQIEEAGQEYDSGSSFNSLARNYGVHPATLKKYLIEAGVQPRL